MILCSVLCVRHSAIKSLSFDNIVLDKKQSYVSFPVYESKTDKAKPMMLPVSSFVVCLFAAYKRSLMIKHFETDEDKEKVVAMSFMDVLKSKILGKRDLAHWGTWSAFKYRLNILL